MRSSVIKLRYFIIFIAVSVLIAFASASAADIFAESSQGTWTADDGWNVVEGENGAEYTKKESAFGSAPAINYTGAVDFNTVEFTVKINNSQGESNIGLSFTLTNGKAYFMEVCYSNRSIRFRETSAGDDWLGGADNIVNNDYDFALDEWFTVKCIFGKNRLELFLNGISKKSFYETGDFDFDIKSLCISSWNTLASVKDIKMYTSSTEIPFGWSVGNWSKTGEGDTAVYTAPSDQELVTMTHRGEFKNNTIEFSAKPNAYRFTEAGFGIVFKCNGGTTDYYFESFMNSAGRHLRLRRGDNGSYALVGVADVEIPLDTYSEFKIVFETDYVLFYVNGNRIVALFDTHGDVFDGKVIFNGWGVAPTVTNIKMFDSELDYAAAGYLDFEFKDERARGMFTCSNGEAAVSDGKFVWNIEDADPELTSVAIDAARGSDYSALLSVRNTLLIRMKNDTAADKVKLSFVTSKDGGYNDAKSKTFDVQPNGDYKTYMINLSDLDGCNGYLRGFKLKFIGVTSGTVSIDAITFEREDPIREYAGIIASCTADPDTESVTVTGSVGAQNAGKTVTVATTPVNNYSLDPDYDGKAYGNPSHNNVAVVCAVKAEADGSFEAEFPLQNGKVSHLSSKFIAYMPDKTLVADAFKITNFRDFTENPYAFTLNDLTADVTTAPYNAKGDAFTDDTAAIQAAVDYVSAQGGGTVLLPGDKTSPFGRRYIATHIVLKDNVEFRIEEGAVLWQSKRKEEYTYEVTYGHDVDIQGLVWCHTGGTVNLPLLYVKAASNVRITGGGTVRMMESGTEQPDGYHYEWSNDGTPNIVLDCGNTIHVMPICVYDSENVELSNITVLRTNIWHTLWAYSRNLYIADNDFRQAECINGDGFGLGKTKNVVLERNFLYTNDDAITLTCEYRDGRGDTFYPSKPGTDHCTENLVIRHNNLFGGLGLTFIPWGTEDPDLSKEEAKNITVYDNVIGGTSRAIGSWPDNPFYGWSSFYDYNLDNGETDDYSPVKDIFIHGNIFRNTVAVGVMKIANAVTDCGLYSSNEFLNASFERELRYPNETEFVSGLSYWSSKLGDGGEVGTEKTGTKTSQIKYPESGGAVSATVGDYAGYVKGDGELYQGLYNAFGAYRFSLKVKLVSGTAKLFARDAVSGKILAEKTVTVSDTFTESVLDYIAEKGTTVQLGIMHEGGAEDTVYIDDASLRQVVDPDLYKVDGEQRLWGFDDNKGYTAYSPSGASVPVLGGLLTVPADCEYKILFDGTEDVNVFDASVAILLNGDRVNSGIYFGAANALYAQDRIDAYNVQVEYVSGSDFYTVVLYKFSSETGYLGDLAKSGRIPLAGNDRITLRTVVKNGTLFAFTDGNNEYVLSYELPDDYIGGSVGLRSHSTAARFDDFRVVSPELVPAAGDKTELLRMLNIAKKFGAVAYTEESFAKLTAAIAQADALGANATQTEIDRVLAMVNAAVNGLVQTAPPTVAADKTGLNMLVGAAKRFDAEMYTSESYKRLETALTAAERVSADGDATEEEITAAIDGVNGALSLLVKADRAVETETKTVTDTGMTVAFYVTLGLLIAVVAATCVVVFVKKKRKADK